MTDQFGRPLDWRTLPLERRLAMWWGSSPRTPAEAEGCLAYADWALTRTSIGTAVLFVVAFSAVYSVQAEERAAVVATAVAAVVIAIIAVLNPLRLRRAAWRYVDSHADQATNEPRPFE